MILSYQTIEAGAIYLLPVYLTAASFAITSIILLLKKGSKKKTNSRKHLIRLYGVLFLAMNVLAAGIIEAYITGYKLSIYRFSLAFGYACINFANIFIILLGKEIFENSFKNYRWDIAVFIIITCLVASPFNYYGIPTEEIPLGLEKFRMISSLLMTIFSLKTYIIMAFRGFITAKHTHNPTSKFGIKMIAFSFIWSILFLVFVVIDTIVFILTDITGYSIFNYLAWSMMILFVLTSYIGYSMPKWIRIKFKLAKK